MLLTPSQVSGGKFSIHCITTWEEEKQYIKMLINCHLPPDIKEYVANLTPVFEKPLCASLEYSHIISLARASKSL